MAGDFVFTVTKLNEYANRVLSNDPHLRSIKVSGEISGFKRHSSGHLYFSLKDADSVIGCVMFRSSAASLGFDPREGAKVIVHGSVSIYPKDGKYQLYVDSMREEGVGDLYKQFLLLKDKLEKEGIFENARPVPVLPKRIGVATSETGAAIHDVITVIRRRFPSMNVLLAPCQVQGDNAPFEIARAVNALSKRGNCDVIIVGRGGGSYEDLYCFNDERVARAIHASSVPVVSAVGHETDFTIADFAADLRAPTPSAAAEICCPKLSDLTGALSSLRDSLSEIASAAVSDARSSLGMLLSSSAMSSPFHYAEVMRERLKAKRTQLVSSASGLASSLRADLLRKTEALEALDPEGVLERGYSIVYDESERIVKSSSELRKGSRLGIRMADGSVRAVVE